MGGSKDDEIRSGIMNSQGDKVRDLEKRVADLEQTVAKLIEELKKPHTHGGQVS